MCGLFGTVRPHHYPSVLRPAAAAALIELGTIAEERGIDSAGIATLHSRDLSPTPGGHPSVQVDTIGRWRIRTALGAFRDLPRHCQARSNVNTARVVLGHTRWATQGACTLANASPMRVGYLIGTHNGDVTAPTWSETTDSAWLFAQLNRATTMRATTSVLTSLRGRAALAWVRRSQPDLVFLARTALSPLATAIDCGGALWWASNPEWLRQISDWFDLGLTAPMSMAEGTLVVLRTDRDEVTLAAHRRFIATSRPRDERLAHRAAWRGLTLADRRHEMAHRHHQVEGSGGGMWSVNDCRVAGPASTG